jgi:hypothetical protein
VGRNVFTIAGRAITSMIQHRGSNDILRLRATVVRGGVEFNLASIGSDVTAGRKEFFDRDSMRALFQYARMGQPWHSLAQGAPAAARNAGRDPNDVPGRVATQEGGRSWAETVPAVLPSHRCRGHLPPASTTKGAPSVIRLMSRERSKT